MSDWVSVKGVPDKYLDEATLIKGADIEEQTAMALALREGKPLKDAMVSAREARKNS